MIKINPKKCKYCKRLNHFSKDCRTFSTASARIEAFRYNYSEPCIKCMSFKHEGDCRSYALCKKQGCQPNEHAIDLCPKQLAIVANIIDPNTENLAIANIVESDNIALNNNTDYILLE